MKSTRNAFHVLVLAALLGVAGCTASQETAVVTDRPTPPPVTETPRPAPADTLAVLDPTTQVMPGRFDMGKMWTFDHPPLDYFEEAYGFRPDSAWFAKARLGTLRLPNCTASFVSPHGLVLTNHHCGREHVTAVARPGENLLDNGFYAGSLDEERRVENLYVDQLISIRDVTDEVYAAATGSDDPAMARDRQAEQIQTRLTTEAKARDTSLTVQVIPLYSGGRYSAYTFRRYNDVRLVMAPEVDLGSFGGDPDNFTYPRYSLDFSLFRLYDPAGNPLVPEVYFPWSTEGVDTGDAVFVVGNPGSTSRLGTLAQLLFERDFSKPREVEFFRTRAEAIAAYIRAEPALADTFDLRNTLHLLENERKRSEGELGGLRDPGLIARRTAAEERLQRAILAADTLRQRYGDVIEEIAGLQRTKEATARQAAALLYFGVPDFESHVLTRAFYARILALMQQYRSPQSSIDAVRKEALAIEDWPAALEEELLTMRLRELQQALGPADPTLNRILSGRTPAETAGEIVANTALLDSARYAALLEEGYMRSGDPTVPLADALTPLVLALQDQASGIASREEELTARLALAQFAVYGTDIPPDASFSLRIADGVVGGYPYNGTLAPPKTTYFGLYSHYYAHGGEDTEWDLPERWLTPPAGFDRNTPLNLVSTNDITGGNSGSPLLNRDLQLVGLIFDSNMEGLPNTYLYTDERARAISVDARGILESLDDIYDADRLVLELLRGQMVTTEAEADQVLGQ